MALARTCPPRPSSPEAPYVTPARIPAREAPALYSTETKLRTFARSLTWRISGVVLTVILAWYFTGDVRLGVELGVTYNLIRLSTHYFHDRAWARLPWGMLHHEGAPAGSKNGNGNGATTAAEPCPTCGQPRAAPPPVVFEASTPTAATEPPRPLLRRVLRRGRA